MASFQEKKDFRNTVAALKARVLGLKHNHNVFPVNTVYVPNTTRTQPTAGAQASVSWAHLGTSPVIIKHFKEQE